MLSDKKIIVPQNLINLAKNTPSIAVGIVCAHHPSIMQSSKQAFEAMINSGISRKKRKDKALIDKISATIILQNYMPVIVAF